jgi:hypothetical protein
MSNVLMGPLVYWHGRPTDLGAEPVIHGDALRHCLTGSSGMIAGRGATTALSDLPATDGLARALSDIPYIELPSSSLLILFVVVSLGGVLVVVCAGFKLTRVLT